MSEPREMSLQDRAKLERLTEQLKANINHAMTPVADRAQRVGLLEAAAICRERAVYLQANHGPYGGVAAADYCASAIEKLAWRIKMPMPSYLGVAKRLLRTCMAEKAVEVAEIMSREQFFRDLVDLGWSQGLFDDDEWRTGETPPHQRRSDQDTNSSTPKG